MNSLQYDMAQKIKYSYGDSKVLQKLKRLGIKIFYGNFFLNNCLVKDQRKLLNVLNSGKVETISENRRAYMTYNITIIFILNCKI